MILYIPTSDEVQYIYIYIYIYIHGVGETLETQRTVHPSKRAGTKLNNNTGVRGREGKPTKPQVSWRKFIKQDKTQKTKQEIKNVSSQLTHLLHSPMPSDRRRESEKETSEVHTHMINEQMPVPYQYT